MSKQCLQDLSLEKLLIFLGSRWPWPIWRTTKRKQNSGQSSPADYLLISKRTHKYVQYCRDHGPPKTLCPKDGHSSLWLIVRRTLSSRAVRPRALTPSDNTPYHTTDRAWETCKCNGKSLREVCRPAKRYLAIVDMWSELENWQVCGIRSFV